MAQQGSKGGKGPSNYSKVVQPVVPQDTCESPKGVDLPLKTKQPTGHGGSGHTAK